MTTHPKMALIEQTLDAEHISDIQTTVFMELDRLHIREKISADHRVAITAGSRGIADIEHVTRAVVDYIKDCGAKPFVFPAMGSHGGASPQGQTQVLAGYGITEDAMGCPIHSSMDVEEIGSTPDGLAIVVDSMACKADHIVVINRVKPHTKFEGPIESGLIKMLAIGMGNHKGARHYHQAAVRMGMGKVIQTAGKVILDRLPVLCGLGLVENGYDQLATIRAVPAKDFVPCEKHLLMEARKRMARIPFSDIDLLIIDEMGKNISGTGMDTNITGVNRDILGSFSSEPQTRRLFVRDLTPETEGNAIGVGLADFTTTRLINKIDRQKTYINSLAGISPEKAAIPMYFDTDRQCMDAAIQCLGMVPAEELRVVHIKNTRSLKTLNVSVAYKNEIKMNASLRLTSDWKTMPFDGEENIISPFF
jgi:Domain of unknown function (DUF362)